MLSPPPVRSLPLSLPLYLSHACGFKGSYTREGRWHKVDVDGILLINFWEQILLFTPSENLFPLGIKCCSLNEESVLDNVILAFLKWKWVSRNSSCLLFMFSIEISSIKQLPKSFGGLRSSTYRGEHPLSLYF